MKVSKLITPIGVVTLVCFFLPWVTVSCAGQPILSDVSAFDLTQGVEVQGEQESEPIFYLIPIGALTLIGAGWILWNRASVIASISALIGALLVLTMWYLFRTGMEGVREDAASQGIVLGVEWQIGYWGALLSGIAGVIASATSFLEGR